MFRWIAELFSPDNANQTPRHFPDIRLVEMNDIDNIDDINYYETNDETVAILLEDQRYGVGGG